MTQDFQIKLANLPALPPSDQQASSLAPTNTANLSPKALTGQANIVISTLSATSVQNIQGYLSQQLVTQTGANKTQITNAPLSAVYIIQEEIAWLENNETIITETASIEGQIKNDCRENVVALSNKSIRDLSLSTQLQANYVHAQAQIVNTNAINIVLQAQSNSEQIATEQIALSSLSNL